MKGRVERLKRREKRNKKLREKRHPAFGEHLLPDPLFDIIGAGKTIYDTATNWGSRAWSIVSTWARLDPQPYADTGFYMDNEFSKSTESVSSQDSWFDDSWSISETRTPSVFGEFEDGNVDSSGDSAEDGPEWWRRKATTIDSENPMSLNSPKSSFFVMTESQEVPTDMYGTQESRLDLLSPNPARDFTKPDYTWESLLLGKEYQLYNPVVRVFNDPKDIMSSPHGYKKRWAADFGTPSVSIHDPFSGTWLQVSMVAVGGVAVVFLGLRIWKRKDAKEAKRDVYRKKVAENLK
ncbi:uncharacterized protein LAJ45_09325 [Morchella importuna]|nr:uncharacterized protein LAJ45_09325 [Morchella importuna]KAH8146642.1 hypothetical protein LAJ45_09325 [Morchella importuna]